VVVNSAGASFKGYFEEMSPAQVEQQLAVNLLGPMNVTRAALPVMRRQRSGHLIAISSGAGLMGFEYSSAYAASKAGLEGWMSALAQEVEPFGIHTTIVNPGFFRTGLASPESLVWPDLAVEDYAERSAAQRAWWSAQDGQQSGDPAKLAAALISIAAEVPSPRRFIAGADVIALAERKIDQLHEEIESHRSLSESLNFDA
jgi:NAD(P)-dependent dehydrogenase (short-subunit alcohol dehydrogenase family)